MRSIYIKELNSFFSSIVGYVAMLIFLVACGLFLWIIPDTSILDYGYATLDRFFEFAPLFLLLLIPAVTMRSFADEFRGGTIEWLSTKPLRDTDIILGKYFAALSLVVFALLPTLIYVLTINNLSAVPDNLDTGGIAGSYIGLIFLAATFTAVGVFCSSLTSNQVVAFLVALFACYILYTGFEALSKVPAFTGGIDYYLSMVGMSFHYNSISRGVIDTRDVIYFIAVIALFVAATRVSLNSRTWDKSGVNKSKKQQNQAAFRLVILAAILVFANILGARFHKGFDLTREKRFTLSDATKRMLNNLDEVVVVDVYLEGKFPAGFQRLSEATRERLQSFKEYGGAKLVYRFTDPLEGVAEEEKGMVSKTLYEKGVQPLSVNVQGDRNSSEQIVYPYALVQYQGRTQAVRLLENHIGMTPREVLNYSESLLEYKLASAIHRLQTPVKPTIAYIMGHGEQLGAHTYDLLSTLTQHYKVDTLDLASEYHINHALYKAIIINKPTQPFDEKDKFKIDQYVMRGGRVLWAIDMLHTPVDSLQQSGQFITSEYGLNLEDQLFNYGVRINNDLIEDIQCNPVPLITGTINTGQPQIELRPWPFLPVFIPTSRHPIVHNMDAIMGKFVSSIDTVDNKVNSKTILLESSNYSRSAASPVRVSLSMLRFNPDPKLYNRPHKAAAVLMEGQFISLFQNRIHNDFLRTLKDSLNYAFKPQTDTSSRMIVISDGDIMLNNYSQARGVEEMGYWDYTKSLFANKNFILNCLEYLTDPNSLLEARSKDLKLRLLDQKRAKDEARKWQAINIGIPVALVLIFASCYMFFRKRRYESKA